MEVTASRTFRRLVFTPDSLQEFLNEAKVLFPSDFRYSSSIKASFDDRTGSFPDVQALLGQGGLPDVLRDFIVWLYSRADNGETKTVRLARGYSEVNLSVAADNDAVWAYGVAEVLSKRLTRIEAITTRAGVARRQTKLRQLWDSKKHLLPSFGYGLLVGLFLATLRFAGWKMVVPLFALVGLIIYLALVVQLILWSIPKTSDSMLPRPELMLLIHPPVSRNADVGQETLKWTRRNAFAAVGAIVMAAIIAVGGALFEVWLQHHSR